MVEPGVTKREKLFLHGTDFLDWTRLVYIFKINFRWGMLVYLLIIMFTSITSCNTLSDSDGDNSVLKAVLYLSGASCVEELGDGAEEELEKLEAMLRLPLEVNLASRSRLLSSGLFSSYQVASLMDYRMRNGDVLSPLELSAVNGFGDEFVDVVTPFLSFSSPSFPGLSSSISRSSEHSAETRSTIRSTGAGEGVSIGYGAKYSVAVGDCLEAGLSLKSPSLSPPGPPDTWSFSLGYYGRRRLTKVIVGDFGARFGQGLCMWSGFSMSGFGSAAGMARRPTGLARYGGFSPSYALRGLAAEASFGRLALSAFGTVPVTGFSRYAGGGNSCAGTNLSFQGMKGECGISVLVAGRSIFEPDKSVRPLQSVRLSMDAHYNIKGADVFGEGAFDVLTAKPALLLGSCFKAGENVRLGAVARYYASGYGKLLMSGGMSTSTFLVAAARAGTYCSDERGLAIAADVAAGKWVAMAAGSSVRRHVLNLSADAAFLKVGHFQSKVNVLYKVVPSPGWTMATKIKVRLRNYDRIKRLELGETVSWDGGLFNAAAYVGSVYCVGLSWVAHLDGGLALPYGDGRRFALSVRGGLFNVGNWDDRIYVYEHDIPGSFNVPALYGRGGWASLLLNWKFARAFRLYLHASFRARSTPTTPGIFALSDFGISLVSNGLRFSCRPRHADAPTRNAGSPLACPPMTEGKNAGSR